MTRRTTSNEIPKVKLYYRESDMTGGCSLYPGDFVFVTLSRIAIMDVITYMIVWRRIGKWHSLSRRYSWTVPGFAWKDRAPWEFLWTYIWIKRSNACCDKTVVQNQGDLPFSRLSDSKPLLPGLSVWSLKNHRAEFEAGSRTRSSPKMALSGMRRCWFEMPLATIFTS